MQIIPIAATPSQTLSVTLGGQSCQISIRQKSTGVFLDLLVSNAPVVLSALCLDRVSIVRKHYSGFVGGLVMLDTQGVTDPDYTGFGSRYLLAYIEATDV
jgi:hypothetical protein